jgi:prolyl-tRNA editing enzyme YbaK/EbsC (Cys-tRNA(Pro) deacylase)
MMSDPQLSPSAQKVADVLLKLNIPCQVIELPASTRTAPEAAEAVGCDVGAIVKSLIFRGKDSREPILILVSGSNRVDEARISSLLNEQILRAEPDFVREQTGFAIGGIPPVAFPASITTLVDEDLLNYEVVWAAAGTPHAVFSIHPSDLVKASGGKVVQVK